MKIGFDAKRLFCNKTGLGNYSRTLVNNYANHVITDDLFLYSPKLGDLAESNSFRNSGQFIKRVNPSHLWRNFKIVNDLVRDQIDIYHGLSNEIPFGIHKKNIKTVVTIHDLIFKVYPKTYPLIDRIFYDIKVRYACKHADVVLAISKSTKQDLMHFYKVPEEKIQVLYQAALPDYYTLLSDEELVEIKSDLSLPDEFILSVGTIEERKNLKNSLKAYSLLDKKIPFVIIGSGKSYKREVLDLIKKLQLNNWIIFLPRKVSNQELKGIYQLASLSLYPSKYEGFGLPVLESQLCKTPVITSITSSLQEAGSNSSIKVDPSNINELKTAMSYLISLKNKTEISTEAYDYCQKKFNPKTLTEKLNKIYINLLR